MGFCALFDCYTPRPPGGAKGLPSAPSQVEQGASWAFWWKDGFWGHNGEVFPLPQHLLHLPYFTLEKSLSSVNHPTPSFIPSSQTSQPTGCHACMGSPRLSRGAQDLSRGPGASQAGVCTKQVHSFLNKWLIVNILWSYSGGLASFWEILILNINIKPQKLNQI